MGRDARGPQLYIDRASNLTWLERAFSSLTQEPVPQDSQKFGEQREVIL